MYLKTFVDLEKYIVINVTRNSETFFYEFVFYVLQQHLCTFARTF